MYREAFAIEFLKSQIIYVYDSILLTIEQVFSLHSIPVIFSSVMSVAAIKNAYFHQKIYGGILKWKVHITTQKEKSRSTC